MITDTMERSWRRMGDILEPYLKAPAGMAEEDVSCLLNGLIFVL